MSGSTSNNIIGSGSDSITLNMAEDQALGVDAQFTVNVDGQQVGGVQTVTASQSAGQTEGFTFQGDWAPGPHDVTVSFANNFIYPGLAGDRNLYVDGVTYDGQTVSNGTTGIYETAFYPPNSTEGNVYGNAVFQVNDTTPVPAGAQTQSETPGAVSVGSGADTLVLNMAEDPYQGDAQFTVSVDGKQIGGTQTTTAVVVDGQSQEFDVHGNFGGGTHTVTVDFLNDQIGGFYPGTSWALDTEDRNLYVMGASLNGGTPAGGAPWELSSSGAHDFTVTAGSNPSATAASSGLFATDGAAADGANIAIPSGAVSSDSMSFVATAADASTPAATAAATPSSASTGMSADTSGTAASVVAAATPTVQDATATTPTATSSGTDTTSTSSGSTGSVFSSHHSGGHFGVHAQG